jgi:hypothetical protein
VERDTLLKNWTEEERQPFAGWDFTYLAGRMIEAELPWSYEDRASELMRNSKKLLDIGTGGAEILLNLQESWPERVVALEGYLPNYILAKTRLEPFGVDVVLLEPTRTAMMPFDDESFDLVINRHAGFNCAEVARVMRHGATFLTQQVHGRSLEDLQQVFGAIPRWPDATPSRYLPELISCGLSIEQSMEHSGTLRFADVGALVYFLKAIPWLVPDFCVEKYQEQLFGLHGRIETDGSLSFIEKHNLIEATKK